MTLGSGPPRPLRAPPPRMRGLCHRTPSPPSACTSLDRGAPSLVTAVSRTAGQAQGCSPDSSTPAFHAPRPPPLAAPHGAEHKFTLACWARAQHPAPVLTAGPRPPRLLPPLAGQESPLGPPQPHPSCSPGRCQHPPDLWVDCSVACGLGTPVSIPEPGPRLRHSPGRLSFLGRHVKALAMAGPTPALGGPRGARGPHSPWHRTPTLGRPACGH